jgi:Gpi18-like mannosyltransferase
VNLVIISKIKQSYSMIPNSLKTAIVIALLVKLLVFSIGYVTIYSIPVEHGYSTNPFDLIMNQFSRWDSPHYLYLAQNGYTNQGDAANFIVFLPFYPLLVRIITVDFSYANLSGLIVSNISSIIAVIYLFKLTRLEYSDHVAKKAIIYLSVFPTAYFLSAVYTESLFLVLVIASIYYARISKWSLAGSLGLLAALTRMGGLILLPTLIVEYIHQKDWKVKNVDKKMLFTSFPLLGFLIYLGINFFVTGNFFTFMEIERLHWYQNLDPLGGLKSAIGWLSNYSYPDSLTIGYAQILFAVFGLVMVVSCFVSCYKFKLRFSYCIFSLFTWMLAVSTGFWLSVPRYILTIFPMFMVLALLSSRKTVSIGIFIGFLVILCFFTWLFTTGAWAF